MSKFFNILPTVFFGAFAVLLLAGQSHASTVRATNLSSFSAFASNEAVPTLGMVSEIPSTGSGEKKDNPIKIYIPLNGAQSQANFTLHTSTTLLPQKKGSGLATVMFSITVTNTDTSSSQILNVGVQDGTDNKFETFIPVTSLADLTVGANSSKEINLRVTLDNICTQVDCSDVDSSSGEDQEDFKIHLFLDTAQNSNTEHTGDENGLYITLKYSSQVPDDNTYTLTSLTKGDERLFANLANGQTITFMGDDVYKTYIHRYSGSAIQGIQSLAAARALGSQHDLVPPVLNGQIKISDLQNGTATNLAFALVNKYQFVSNMCESQVQTPEDILALLEGQSCYLVTAGFQREHPVLDSLRAFRDRHLLTTSWGKRAVFVYYKTAPLFVPIILDSPVLAWIIRVMAYIFFAMIEYTMLVMTGLSVIFSCVFILIRRRQTQGPVFRNPFQER